MNDRVSQTGSDCNSFIKENLREKLRIAGKQDFGMIPTDFPDSKVNSQHFIFKHFTNINGASQRPAGVSAS